MEYLCLSHSYSQERIRKKKRGVETNSALTSDKVGMERNTPGTSDYSEPDLASKVYTLKMTLSSFLMVNAILCVLK